jgi:phage terminase large subunit GpA-like protein
MIDAASPELRAALRATIVRSLGPLEVPMPMRLSRWAQKFFYLSAESSYVEGHWRSWPFQVGMMDVMAHEQVPQVTIRKSARVGYTKMLLACVAYMAEHKRRNQIVYQPTDDDRDEFVTTELEPMLRDVRVMRKVMRRFGGRSKHNTLRQKKFTTGLLHLRGGKAAKNFRRLTADCVYYDEFSGFDRDIEKEGSPGKLGDKRLEGSVFPKSIAGSTPKLKNNDNTEDRETQATCRLQWHVPCRHCHEIHPLTFGGKDKPHGLKWFDNDPTTVVHVCPHCGGHITQADYFEQWHAGVWMDPATGIWLDTAQRHQGGDEALFRTREALDWRQCELAPDLATIVPPPEHVAIHVWTACAPQATWVKIAEEFIAAAHLAARGDASDLKTFVNTTLGETWEEKGEVTDEHALQQRAEDYPLAIVPKCCLILTAGGDLQGNRFELGVWGWGEGLESWDIDHVVIEMNPASDEDWLAVEQHLMRRYTQAWHGGSLPISAVSIDSNYQTQAVYNFVRRMQHRLKIHAIKGEGAEGHPIKGPGRSQDVSWKGARWPNGVKQWAVGVDSAKDLLHGQLQITQPGPGYVHLNKARPREWFEQLTAEQRIDVKGPTGTVQRWVKRRARNEVLDTRNYALHAAYMLGLHQYTHRDWVRLEAAVQPPPDLFTVAAPAPQHSDDQAAIPAVVAPPSIVQPPPAVARRQAEPSGRHW